MSPYPAVVPCFLKYAKQDSIALVAENSAAQYFSPAAGIDPDAMAQGFLQIWLQSPSHRQNVIYKEFDRAGIGVAVNGNTIYASTVFAADLAYAR